MSQDLENVTSKEVRKLFPSSKARGHVAVVGPVAQRAAGAERESTGLRVSL